MTEPEWRERRTVLAVDADGHQIPVSTGVILLDTGIAQAVLQVGRGPVVILDLDAGSHLKVNVEHSLLDARTIERRGGGS